MTLEDDVFYLGLPKPKTQEQNCKKCIKKCVYLSAPDVGYNCYKVQPTYLLPGEYNVQGQGANNGLTTLVCVVSLCGGQSWMHLNCSSSNSYWICWTSHSSKSSQTHYLGNRYIVQKHWLVLLKAFFVVRVKTCYLLKQTSVWSCANLTFDNSCCHMSVTFSLSSEKTSIGHNEMRKNNNLGWIAWLVDDILLC